MITKIFLPIIIILIVLSIIYYLFSDNLRYSIDSKDTEEVTTAEFFYRALAYLIDCLLFMPITIIAVRLYEELFRYDIVLFVVPVAFMLYKVSMEHKYGATIGKWMMGIRVVSLDDSKINLSQSLRRYIIYASEIAVTVILYVMYVTGAVKELPLQNIEDYMTLELDSSSDHYLVLASFLVVFASALTFFFNKKHQCLHDKIASTYVVSIIPKYKYPMLPVILCILYIPFYFFATNLSSGGENWNGLKVEMEIETNPKDYDDLDDNWPGTI